MTRKEYLHHLEGIYKATRGLMDLIPAHKLTFKPIDGLMTVAQILKHLTTCLGASLSPALNNSWPDIPEEEMLPSAEKMPKSETVREAINEFEQDWELLKQELEKITDEEFNQNKVTVPWMPYPMTIVDYMMQAMEHLCNHRMQLFIWLKLAGMHLNTGHLYGMP